MRAGPAQQCAHPAPARLDGVSVASDDDGIQATSCDSLTKRVLPHKSGGHVAGSGEVGETAVAEADEMPDRDGDAGGVVAGDEREQRSIGAAVDQDHG